VRAPPARARASRQDVRVRRRSSAAKALLALPSALLGCALAAGCGSSAPAHRVASAAASDARASDPPAARRPQTAAERKRALVAKVDATSDRILRRDS